MAKRRHARDGHDRRPRSRNAKPDRATPWLYGVHAVVAALANPRRRCRRLVVTRDCWCGLAAMAERGDDTPEPEFLDRQEIDRLLSPGAVHQGVALLADPLPEPDLAGVLGTLPDSAVIVVLDQATDPRNVGAVLRSADAFGARAVIVQDRHAPEATAAMAKAASGALETVALVRAVNIARALGELKDAGFWCFGLDACGDTTLAEADLSGRIALVLGSEGKGLRPLVRQSCDVLARIPLSGTVDSLNLSNAAAVALYEVARKRG